jgi:hypothetical protein
MNATDYPSQLSSLHSHVRIIGIMPLKQPKQGRPVSYWRKRGIYTLLWNTGCVSSYLNRMGTEGLTIPFILYVWFLLFIFLSFFPSFSLQKQKCCFIDKNDTPKRIYDWGTSRIQNMGSRNAIHREDSNSWRHSIRSRTNASKKGRWGGVRIRLWTAATDGDIVHPPGDIWTWKLPGSEIGFVLNFVATTSLQIPWYSILK